MRPSPSEPNPSRGWRRACRWLRLGPLLIGYLVHGQGSVHLGISEPVLDAVLAFPVTGIVTTRLFPEGAAVRKGQVILELDKRLEELDVERRRLAMQLAQAELERLQTLARKNAISVSREETDKKQAEFEIARVEHEIAQEMVRRRQLMAPADGFIAQYFKQVGEACDEERTPVARFVDTSRCLFVVDCEPSAARGLQTGQKARLQFDGPQGVLDVAGTIHFIAPVVDAASGLLRVKILFENTDRRIRPGISGRLILE